MSEFRQRLANLSPAKRQLLEQRLRQSAEAAEPIAIVGMACRFPGAADLDAYWRLILDGREATGEIPPSRWNADEFYDASGELSGKMSSRWGGFVDDVDQFDPLFFGITPREARKMDPQQRLLLEVAWEALEQGGIAPERLSGSATGVFIGIGGTDYSKFASQMSNYFQQLDPHVGTGNALSIAANRISYILDLKGPSLAIDTACSSGLVGVHLAVRSLRQRECNAALAGGVNLILTPETMIAFSKARMLSADGHCRPFDSRANGYVRGEGCAIVVLKRLTDAVRDGDNVFAVIRGTAVNQDGRTSGITAPNGLSQQAVIRTALADAGLSAERISYIEAHGTGTPLGDPIEIQSLGKLFAKRTPTDPPCYVTSVKANIGHTETVSGVAGLLKVVLMLQHGQVPPQLHLEQLNPNISLAGTRLVIPTKALPWRPGGEATRVAGISSFGFGGTNAHVIVEEAAAAEAAAVSADRPLHLLTLSAKTETALRTLAGRYAQRLQALESESSDPRLLANFCYTANAGRTHFNHRLTIAADTPEQLRTRLSALAEGQSPQGVKSGQVRIALRPKVGMLFTGQGSQYVGMGRTLFDTHPVFRQTLQQCQEILRSELEEPLLSVLYPEGGRPSPLDSTAYTQPALFALEYAVAMLWRSWGIEPDVLLGHSVGEYVAACVAGVMSLEDGLRLITGRARLMQQLPAGGMMAAVFAPAEQVARAIASSTDQVAIAAANGPENTVISGPCEAVRAILSRLEAAGVRAQPLVVSHAFHSPLMEPMLDEFEQLAGAVEYQRPQTAIVSNLTGRLMGDQPPDARYWRKHLRGTVQFAAGMQTLAEQELHVLVEVGPAPTLIGMGRRCLPQTPMVWLPSLRKGRDDWQVLLDSLAEMYVLGVKVNWHGFDGPWPRRRLALPTYPFERTRLWLEESPGGTPRSAARGPSLHPLLGSRVPSALETTLYEVRLSSASPRYLVDHQVQGSPVMPAAAYVEQGLAAAEQLFGPGRHVLENVAIQQAMFLAAGVSRTVEVTVSAERGGEANFETYSTPAESEDPKPRWTLHACGTLRHADTYKPEQSRDRIDLDDVRRRAGKITGREEFYQQIAARGLAYGPAFRVLDDLGRSDRDALAAVRLPQEVLDESKQYHLHPALLDACFQSMAGAVPLEPDGGYSPYTYMPTAVRRVVIRGDLTEQMYTYAVRTSADNRPSPETVEGDVYLLSGAGEVLVELCGVRVQRVGRGATQPQHEVDTRQWLYQVRWQSQTKEAGPAESLAGNWLIFADRQGVGDRLAEVVRERGGRAIRVHAGRQFADLGGDQYQIDPLKSGDYQQLLEQALDHHRPACRGVVFLWSLDVQTARETGTARSSSHENRDSRPLVVSPLLNCASALELVKHLVRHKFNQPPAVWMATQGAQQVAEDREEVTAPGQAALWGLGRVAAMEHPELRCRLVDLEPGQEPAPAAAFLAAELASESDEDQLACRDGKRCVARLEPAPAVLPAQADSGGLTQLSVPAEGAFRLRLGAPGSFDSLRFESFARRGPGAGQVEIEVRAAGLNFSDVLKALGLYPGITDEIVPLGIECSGIVTALGEGVDRFRVGDAVMGVAPYSFASHAITAEYALVHKPQNIADAEAATIPITFMTAYYGLVTLARLQPGERVLIHAGAGGVGLAAIQIARHLGAEVFATAGSEQKRDFLRALGVPHVMSSRTLDFADEILKLTGHRGVDVVLNSLPGEAIPKSLSILSAYGRFLEIGKTDIYQNRMIGLLPFQDNLSYCAIDLDRMLRQRPAMIRRLFAEVMEHFTNGVYRPLAMTQFATEEAVAAFRYMAQRKNIGKVVVSLQQRGSGTVEPAASGTIRGDATYLITGGLGALGLEVADWLTTQGARRLVLMARRAAAGSTLEAVERLRAKGASVAVVRGDVAREASLAAALAQIPPEFPPLAGVIHAAGVLADGLMFNMDLEQLDRAMAPKVQGAWNLHAATETQKLDFFVLFSSVACVLGSPGQANYAAGNAFLDALAHYRRRLGLAATSINWGPWANAGMAAEAGRGEQIQSRGLGLVPAEEGLKVLQGLLGSAAANVAVMDARWADMRRALRGRIPPLLRDVAREEASPAAEPQDGKVDHAFRQKLLGVALQERQSLLRQYFTDELARIMGLDAAGLDAEQPLNTLGLDSLMAIELKNNLESRLAFSLPMARFLEGPSVTSLAQCAAELIVENGTGSPATEVSAAAPVAANGAASTTWAPLLPLARNGNKPPLFCIHPVGGDVRCYYALARAMEDRPVYALRARGMDCDLAPHHSVAEMAADYMAAIRQAQPQGPYYLAGWSTGGIFAYEMARLLRERGERVELVFFDAPLPTIFQDVDLDDDARFLYDLVNFSNYFAGAEMQVSYEALRAQGAEERLQTTLDEAIRHGVLPAEMSVDFLRRTIDVCRAHVQAVMEYVPPTLDQTLHVFRPQETEVLAEASGQFIEK
ncbi:MAG: SDR family NAD(P)-dependent oxidoreductase, partial [Thermoguttaceae bacterium]